jgi:hypothetical protein
VTTVPDDAFRRGGRALAAALAVVVAGGLAAGPAGAVADEPVVRAGCLGVDPGAGSTQLRVGLVVDGPDGLYRAVLGGPSGPVQGEGRVAGGRGLVVVPVRDEGEYAGLVLTVVGSGQAVRLGALTPQLPVTVGAAPAACDPTTLVVADLPPETVESGAGTTTTSVGSEPAPTPEVSTAVPVVDDAEPAADEDAPPWALLAIPGGILVVVGIVLLVRARSGSRSPRTT